jgi:hypothetical protein
MQLFSKLKLEVIIWEDISQAPETWSSAGDIELWYKDEAECLVDQVGYVIFEDNNNLLIADSYIESQQAYGNVHKIPKAVIRSRQHLNRAPD